MFHMDQASLKLERSHSFILDTNNYIDRDIIELIKLRLYFFINSVVTVLNE